MSNIKNVCARSSFKDSNGNEKVSWNKIGIIISKGDKEYLKLYYIPNTMFYIFEQQNKEQKQEENADWAE